MQIKVNVNSVNEQKTSDKTGLHGYLNLFYIFITVNIMSDSTLGKSQNILWKC